MRWSRSFMMPAEVKLFECEAMRQRWRGVSFFLASVEIGNTKGVLGDDLAAIGECDDDAGLLDCRQLVFDPGADVVDRGSQPRIHCAPICEGST
ncbi:hypothetical protein AB7M71_005213 [Bradyrhizobium japonicum]